MKKSDRSGPWRAALPTGWLLLVVLFSWGNAFGNPAGEVRQLSNGLSFFYQQDSSRSQTYFSLTLKGGARLDGPGSDGAGALWSQLFWERGEDSLRYSRYAAQRGIRTSARHDLSATQFGMRSPVPRMAEALRILLFALEDVDYPGHDLDRERKKYALFLQDLDFNPAVFLERQLGEMLWQEDFPELHRYGYYPDLAQLGPSHFKDLHRTFLHPGNAILTCSGPLPEDRVFALADSVLGVWTPPGATPYLHLKAAPELEGSRYEVFLNELSEVPVVQLIWQVPGAFSGTSRIQIADWFVKASNARSGMFHRSLIGSGVASSFAWDYQPTRGPGQLSLQIIPQPDRVRQCLLQVDSLLGALAGGQPFSFATQLTAQNKSAYRYTHQMDQPTQAVSWSGQRWSVGLETGLTTLFEPGPGQVRDFVADYLWRQPHVGGLLLNSRLAAAFREDFAPAWQPVPEADTVETAPEPLVTDAEREWLEKARVYFKSSSFDPDSSSLVVIGKVADLVQQVPESHLVVNGYADGQGDGVYNYQLSIQRAQSVFDLLSTRYGIAADRMNIRPWGEAFPEFEEDSPEKMALNRRVTFDLILNDAQP